MKKGLLILLAGIVLSVSTSCEEVEDTSTPTIITIDETLYDETTFLSIEEIYMLPGETYDLSLMKKEGVNTVGITYTSSMPDFLSVDDNGVLTAISNNSAEKLTVPIYVYNTTQLHKVNVHIVDYEIYGSYFTSIDKGRLYGKNVVFFGDSNTHNWLKYPNGDKTLVNETNSLGYPDHYVVKLNQICNFASVTNAAWSGGTMSYLPTSKERYTWKSFPGAVNDNEEAIKNSDYIFVFYGTNDLSEQVNPGTIIDEVVLDDKTSSTFGGAMRYGIERIREFKSDANIIFLNVPYRTYPYYGSYDPEDYNKVMLDACLYYHCKYIDVYSMYDSKEWGTYLNNDGLHFSTEGYQLLTDYLLNNGVRKD